MNEGKEGRVVGPSFLSKGESGKIGCYLQISAKSFKHETFFTWSF